MRWSAQQTVRRNYNVFRNTRFGVAQGAPAFEIATNLTNWSELGTAQGGGHWLEGNIAGEGKDEFLFNGRLFLPQQAGAIIDNFPKNPAPQGWTKRPLLDAEGYDLVAHDGIILFRYKVAEKFAA